MAADQSVVLCRALAAEAELPVPEHQVGALHSMRLTAEGDQAVCVLQVGVEGWVGGGCGAGRAAGLSSRGRRATRRGACCR